MTETTTNPTGAAFLARLLAGEPPAPLPPPDLPEPWSSLALDLLSFRRQGDEPLVDVFERLVAGRPDAAELRRQLRAAALEPDAGAVGADTESLSSFDLLEAAPELPASARLPDGLLAGRESVGRWLDDYIAFGELASPMSPPIFHRMLGLSLLSTAIARRVFLRAGSHNLYPNTYTLIVAGSTLYAKTTALEIARDVLQHAGLERLTLPVGITPQSLIGELTNRQPETFATWDESDQEDWRRERRFAAQRLWLMDEAASLLDAFDQKHLADLLHQVLKLFDCPQKLSAASTIARGRQTIRNAYLTICGPTTPAALRAHLKNPSHWGNGLFARFAFVTPEVEPRRVFYPQQVLVPAELVTLLRSLALERLPMPAEGGRTDALRAELAPGVWERWDAYHAGMWELIRSDAVSERLSANYGRFHTLAMKIAMQLAAADWAASPGLLVPQVSLLHWARAQSITEELRASLHRTLALTARSGDEDLEVRVLRLLRQAGRGFTGRELAISLGMSGSQNRDLLERTLQRMDQDGLLEMQERKGARGPAARVWQVCRRSPVSGAAA